MTEVNRNDVREPLRLGEFAAAMGVGKRTARRWAKEGKAPGAFQTPGGHWRVPAETVDRMRGAA